MEPITASRIRTISQAAFAEQGYPVATPDPLDRLVIPAANALVIHLTGWETFNAVPADKEPLVELAVRLAVEMQAAQSTPDYLETLADFDLISSFSAGSYSETRRSAEDAIKAKALTAWPALDHALVAAMTDDKHDDYLAWLEDQVAPGFAVTEMDWSGRGLGGLESQYETEDPLRPWPRAW
jgi:hypothetical protein